MRAVSYNQVRRVHLEMLDRLVLREPKEFPGVKVRQVCRDLLVHAVSPQSQELSVVASKDTVDEQDQLAVLDYQVQFPSASFIIRTLWPDITVRACALRNVTCYRTFALQTIFPCRRHVAPGKRIGGLPL